MCQTKSADGWQRELPQEEGDYLWVAQWSCGCARKAGLAYVYPVSDEDLQLNGAGDRFIYETPAGRMAAAWGHNPPDFCEGKPDVDWWKRIDLPPAPEED